MEITSDETEHTELWVTDLSDGRATGGGWVRDQWQRRVHVTVDADEAPVVHRGGGKYLYVDHLVVHLVWGPAVQKDSLRRVLDVPMAAKLVTVTGRGPVQTPSGKRHASQTSWDSWGSYNYDGVPDPEWLDGTPRVVRDALRLVNLGVGMGGQV